MRTTPPISALLVLAIACGAAVATLQPAPTTASVLAAGRDPGAAPTPSPTPVPWLTLPADAVHAVATAVARGAEPPPRALEANERREVTTIVAWLAAYNAGDLGTALALMDDRRFSYTDCDYVRGRLFGTGNERELAAWLRERFAEHDRLVLGSLGLGPATAATAVRLDRRTSASLGALGFPGGIAPTTFVGKWVVTPGPRGQGGRLRQVMLAASSAEDCTLSRGAAAPMSLPRSGGPPVGVVAFLLGGLAAVVAGLASRGRS